MACYQSFMAVFLPSWTSPWRFRRIVSMSKSGVGDVWMRATPCVTIWGGKPRRNTSPRCIWRDELPVLSRKHTSSRLSTERHLVSSVTQVVASTRDFLEGSLSLYPPVWTIQTCKQPSTSPHAVLQDTSSLMRLFRTWKWPRSLCCMLLDR